MPSEEEEAYFQRVEAETRAKLRAKLDRQAADLEEQRKIATTVATGDLEVAARIKALGFDGESAKVFDLLPLIYVAWADGSIQRGERAAILRILEGRGVEKGSEPFTTVESLLEEKPSDAYIAESLAVLRELINPGERQQDERAESLVDLCVAVADASGGFLGLGQKVGDAEREVIAKIAAGLGERAAAKLKADLG